MFALRCFVELGGLRLRAQSEIKGSSVSRRGFSPDSATVAMNDALNGGQADAGTFEIFLAMKALEDAK